jgi:hypothetical protein
MSIASAASMFVQLSTPSRAGIGGIDGAEPEPRAFGRPKHRLGRHAGPVRALAADEPALDDGELGVAVESAEGADEVLARRPSTENDDPHS